MGKYLPDFFHKNEKCNFIDYNINCVFSELRMMEGIIPEENKRDVFEKISRGSLNLIIQEAEGMIEKVKKASENDDFFSIFYLFEVVKHFDALKPKMDETLKDTDPSIKGQKPSTIGV